MSGEEEQRITLLNPYGEDEGVFEPYSEKHGFVKKPEIDEEVEKNIELILKNDNKSIIQYIRTLDQSKEKEAEILNYLLIWAIQKNKKDIINILIDEKNAKLNRIYEKDSFAISYVLARMTFFEDVINKIEKSINPPYTYNYWITLKQDYKNAQIEVKPPPTVSRWNSFFGGGGVGGGGGGGKRKQHGGFRKKHKISKYKTKKFKKIYKKKKHNRKTRKYK